MEEEKDTAEELERLLCLRLAFGRYPRRVAQDLSLNEWHKRLLFVLDQIADKKTFRPRGTPVTSSNHPDTKKMPTQKSDFHYAAK